MIESCEIFDFRSKRLETGKLISHFSGSDGFRNFGELKWGGQFSAFLGGVVNFRLVFELGNCSLFIKVLQGKFGLC